MQISLKDVLPFIKTLKLKITLEMHTYSPIAEMQVVNVKTTTKNLDVLAIIKTYLKLEIVPAGVM